MAEARKIGEILPGQTEQTLVHIGASRAAFEALLAGRKPAHPQSLRPRWDDDLYWRRCREAAKDDPRTRRCCWSCGRPRPAAGVTRGRRQAVRVGRSRCLPDTAARAFAGRGPALQCRRQMVAMAAELGIEVEVLPDLAGEPA